MIAVTYFLMALLLGVFEGKQSSLDCNLRQPQHNVIVSFSAVVGAKGELHSDVIQKIDERKLTIGVPQTAGDEIIVTSGGSNRFTWLFGNRRNGYSFELTDYPASQVAHFLITEHSLSGGRHGFDRLAGYGTCKLTLGGGRSLNR